MKLLTPLTALKEQHCETIERFLSSQKKLFEIINRSKVALLTTIACCSVGGPVAATAPGFALVSQLLIDYQEFKNSNPPSPEMIFKYIFEKLAVSLSAMGVCKFIM
jgi:hypothetical protein